MRVFNDHMDSLRHIPWGRKRKDERDKYAKGMRGVSP